MPALPVPRLTATVYQPAGKGMFGAVVVTLGGRERDPAEDLGYEVVRRRSGRVGRVRCSICKVIGHSSSNRKHHPTRG